MRIPRGRLGYALAEFLDQFRIERRPEMLAEEPTRLAGRTHVAGLTTSRIGRELVAILLTSAVNVTTTDRTRDGWRLPARKPRK